MAIDNTVIVGTTGAAQFDFAPIGESQVTISASNLAGGETVTVQVRQGASTWFDTTVVLDATTGFAQFKGPGRFRLNKSATVGSSAVFLDGDYVEL